MRAVPVPDTTYIHCSAHACSLTECSLLSPPGARVIVAACDVRVRCNTAKLRRRAVVVCTDFMRHEDAIAMPARDRLRVGTRFES
jgi:hypothetical protein